MRLVPLDWVGQPAMRAQVSLCDEEEKKEEGNQEQPAADHPADKGYAGMAALHHSRKEHSRSDQAKKGFAGMANLYRDVFGGPENRAESTSRHSRGFSASSRMMAPDSASLYKDPRSWAQSDHVPVTRPPADGAYFGHLLSDVAAGAPKAKSGDAPNSISEMIKRII